MKRLENSFLLLLIIIIEGYVILSAELLAIRLTIPFVGSGTDTVSVIIAAVLLPLALGYRAGGKFKAGKDESGQYLTIRKKLLRNLMIASCFFLPALSYALLFFFFLNLDEMGLDNKLFQITLYCALFIVVPIYLLGQTIPLVSNFFSKEKLSQITGRMLFFSTVGSFLGAVFSTLVLMQHIGAHHTASLIFILLGTLSYILSKKKNADIVIMTVAVAVLALLINSDMVMTELKIIKNNKYNTMQVYEDEMGRHLIMNNNDSSLYNEQRRKHEYVEFTERVALRPILNSPTPKEILIVGAGAFTFGHEDKQNHYTFVDIDGDLLEVAEKYILKEKLDGHKEFIVMDIRPYLHIARKKFDVIFLDAYLGGLSIPENLVTQEFFQQIKNAMNDGGILVTNFIVSPNFGNAFSKNLDNTLRSVFPHISRHIIQQDKYNMWNDDHAYAANVAYVYRHEENYDMGGILSDPPDIDIKQTQSETP